MFRRLSLPIAEIIILIILIIIGIGVTPILIEIATPFRVKDVEFGSVEGLSQEEMNELSAEITKNRNPELFQAVVRDHVR